MRHLKNILLAVLALLLQSTWCIKISIFGIQPDLPILVLVYLALSEGAVMGTVYGFFIGFCQDIYTPENLGVHSFINTLLGFLLGEIRFRVTVENLFVIGLVIFSATAVGKLGFLLISTSFRINDLFVNFIRYGFFGALYTASLAIIIIQLKKRFGKSARGDTFINV